MKEMHIIFLLISLLLIITTCGSILQINQIYELTKRINCLESGHTYIGGYLCGDFITK